MAQCLPIDSNPVVASVEQVSDSHERCARYLRRESAARYIREEWGMPCEASWLAKLAVTGGGPVFRKCGRFPIYAVEDLDVWAQGRLSAPMRSTSDAP